METDLDIALKIPASSYVIVSFIVNLREWIKLVRVQVNHMNALFENFYGCFAIGLLFFQIQILSGFICNLAVVHEALIPFINITPIIVLSNLIFQSFQNLPSLLCCRTILGNLLVTISCRLSTIRSPIAT